MGRNLGLPHYRRIANELLAALPGESDDADRTSVPGSGPGRLPSERALMRKFGVARNTARRALNELRRRGVARRLQGSGSFLAPKLPRCVFAVVYLIQKHPRWARLIRLARPPARAGIDPPHDPRHRAVRRADE